MGYAATAMRCPFCSYDDTRVVDSRPAEGGASIRRRRECEACANRFTTYERSDLPVIVRKRDGSREPFQADKVLRGLERALAGRPAGAGDVGALVERVRALAAHRNEVSSEEIGREVLAGLRTLDEVAYLRFASVYKDFQGADDFEREVASLEGNGSGS